MLALLVCIMPGFQPPQWDFTPAVLALGEGIWVFHKNPDAIPLLLAIEVQAQAIPHARGIWATGKGAEARICIPQKYHIIYLRVVLCMNEKQLVLRINYFLYFIL